MKKYITGCVEGAHSETYTFSAIGTAGILMMTVLFIPDMLERVRPYSSL